MRGQEGSEQVTDSATDVCYVRVTDGSGSAFNVQQDDIVASCSGQLDGAAHRSLTHSPTRSHTEDALLPTALTAGPCHNDAQRLTR